MKTAAALLLSVLLTAAVALGEGAKLTALHERLARAVAVVAAHEGALKTLRDVDLIWQSAQFNGDTDAKRLAWLQMHSGRALGIKPCVGESNCLWSGALAHGARVVSAETIKLGKVDPGYWRTVTVPRFERVLARARELVSGAPYERPCPIEPRTWGGVGRDPLGADDREHAAGEGLFPIGCVGTLNDGFAPRSAFNAAPAAR